MPEDKSVQCDILDNWYEPYHLTYHLMAWAEARCKDEVCYVCSYHDPWFHKKKKEFWDVKLSILLITKKQRSWESMGILLILTKQ